MGNVSSSNGNNENVPKLRFPQFQGEWEDISFSDLFEILSNNTLSRAELSECGDIKNIHYGDVLIKYGDTLDITSMNIPFVNPLSGTKRNDVFLSDGDVIIADTAEDETVGKSTEIYNVSDIKVVSGLHTIPCRPKLDFVSKYLGFYLNSPHFHRQLLSLMQGVKVLSISKSNIATTVIRYPTKQEQQKIAAFLTLLDKRIAKQRELVESLKLYKRGVFKNIFSSISQFRKLQDISGYLTSDISLESIGNKSSGNFPVYDASGISLYISDYKIESDYIAIIKDGSGVGRLQYCSGKSSFIGTLGGIVANGCSVAYLYAAMQMIDFRQFVTGATIPHIYYKDYKNIAIPFPDFETQRKIERVSELLDRDIVIADEKICLLNKLREGLLQQLFI